MVRLKLKSVKINNEHFVEVGDLISLLVDACEKLKDGKTKIYYQCFIKQIELLKEALEKK